ncbi:MAG: flagellar biosynthesis protein FlhA [Cyanobacteria bacterium RYN_339]|nr:flagellar biosynthesis protein FlhA [Cyanobacteria bacterium RYN_339]
MLEERAVEQEIPAEAPPEARPALRGELGQLVLAAMDRQECYRPLIDQLAYAIRIAESPEALDRATIPLAMPFGPAKMKELGAQIRLSSYLKGNLQALIAIYRAERQELRRLERAARLASERPELAIAPATAALARGLFTWIEACRGRFLDYPAIHGLMKLDFDAHEILAMIPRALPDELADCFATAAPALPPEPPPPRWRGLLETVARLGGKPTGTAPLQAIPDARDPENVLGLIGVAPLTLELGPDLVKLVDPALGGELMDRMAAKRTQMVMETGFVMPGVQFKDHLGLAPQSYQIRVRDIVVARGEAMPTFLLAIATPQTDTDDVLAGFATRCPATGREAVWIPPALGRHALALGYEVLDATEVVLVHFDEAVRASAYEILSYEEVQIMLAKVAERAPTTVKHVVPDRLDFAEFHQVLRALLRERVSMRDLPLILERLGHLLVFPRVDPNGTNPGTFLTVHLDPSDQSFGRNFERLERAMPRAQAPLDTPALVENLRQAINREICSQLADDQDQLDVVTIAASLETQLIEALAPCRDGRMLALPPALADRTLLAIQDACRHQAPAVIVCDARLRAALKRFTMRDMPRLHVLAHAEVHPQFRARTVATVGLADG